MVTCVIEPNCVGISIEDIDHTVAELWRDATALNKEYRQNLPKAQRQEPQTESDNRSSVEPPKYGHVGDLRVS